MSPTESLPPSRRFLLYGCFSTGRCRAKRKQPLAAELAAPLWSQVVDQQMSQTPDRHQKPPTSIPSTPGCLFLPSHQSSSPARPEGRVKPKGKAENVVWRSPPQPSRLFPHGLSFTARSPLGSPPPRADPHILLRALGRGQRRGQTRKAVWAPNYAGLSG